MKPIAQAVTTATFYEDDFWLLGLPEDLHDARRNNKFYENRVEFRDALTMDRCVEVAEGKRLIIAKAKAAFQDNNGFKGSK